MNKTLSQRFPRISTIDMVYGPVERFRDRLDPAEAGAGALSPLDAYLLNLVLEFSPRPAFVADLACDATSGDLSVVCLANPCVSRVGVASSGAPRRAGGAGLAEILEEFSAESDPGRGGSVLPLGRAESAWDEVRASLSPHEMPLFLLDADEAGGEGRRRPGEVLDEFPEGLVLVLGVGKAGECEALARLVGECRGGSPHRLHLMREVAGPLAESRLAMVARDDHPSASAILERIGHAFTTNYNFLDLVRDSCMYAVEKGVARDLNREIDGLRAEVEGKVHGLNHEAHLRDLRDQEIARLHRAHEESRAALLRVDEESRRLRLQLDREFSRPVVKALILQSSRRVLHFGRKNRALLAPAGGHRERTLKAFLRFQRRLRGKVA